jgi:hypothetical protein
VVKARAITIAVVLALVPWATGCSGSGAGVVEALTECIEDAGETPQSPVKAELGPNGEILVVSAPGISVALVEQCIDDVSSGRSVRLRR